MRANQFLWILVGLLSSGVYAQHHFYTPNAGMNGNQSTFVGHTGVGTTGDLNTAVGDEALFNSSGSNNCAFGTLAMGLPASAASGSNNCAFGYRALMVNTSGQGNVAVGVDAMRDNQSGNLNIALGHSALRELQSGEQNIAIGVFAGQYNTEMSPSNIIIGREAGESSCSLVPNLETNGRNIIIGFQAGNHLTGDQNIAIGYNAGTNFTGNRNTFLGGVNAAPSDVSSAVMMGRDGSNSVFIADGAGNQKIVIDGTLDGTGPRCNIGLGLGNLVRPQNKLDLNTAGAVSGTLGFRFRGLGSAITGTSLTANSNNLVMTVNSNGDVIMVPDGGSGSGTTSVTAGTNTTVTGTGATTTPYVINAQNLYTNDGTIENTTGNTRTITLADKNIFFKTTTSQTDYGKGRVYIGASESYASSNPSGNYKLLVEGGILTEKVKVALRNPTPGNPNNWADYVFDDNYNLPSLKEVE
ncbi:MAG TPA: hypothetical protein VK183_08970, partial [Flavobacterium sp.]|nr:hypothetical protein [Flavobacterium sp.]